MYRSTSKRPLLGLLALFLTAAPLALTGCQALPVQELTSPDPVLLQPCSTEAYPVATNGQLAKALLLTRKDYELCANKVEALRLWHQANPKP